MAEKEAEALRGEKAETLRGEKGDAPVAEGSQAPDAPELAAAHQEVRVGHLCGCILR